MSVESARDRARGGVEGMGLAIADIYTNNSFVSVASVGLAKASRRSIRKQLPAAENGRQTAASTSVV